MQQKSPDSLVNPFQRLSLFKDNHVAQAVSTKVVEAHNQTGYRGTGSDGRGKIAPDQDSLERISKLVANDIDDAYNMLQVLPDLAMAKEIMTSLIAAPKDLISHEFTWGTKACELPAELVGELTESLQTYFTQDYKIDDLTIPAIEDACFNTGSYPLVIIPESSVDNIINQNGRIALESLQADSIVTQEGHSPNRAILGPGYTTTGSGESRKIIEDRPKGMGFGLEGLLSNTAQLNISATAWFDDHVRILDSMDNLKLPLLQERLTQQLLRDRMNYGNVSLEHIQRDVELERLEQALYVRRSSQHVPVITVDRAINGSRLPKGHPLVMKLPSESIIPVHTPGSPQDHLGYFVLIDEFGNPVTRAQSADYYKQMTSNMNTQLDQQGSQASSILSNVKTFMGPNCQANKYDGLQLLKAYSGMMEAELLQRLKRGIYGENIELSDIAERVYAIMLARSLANMRTSLLYVPVEQCTYIAFDYDHAGTGRSLLSDVKILGALRSLLLFADVQGSIKNSIPRRKVNVNLDENIPDPFKAVEMIKHEVAKTMNTQFPLGVTDPRTQLDMLQKAGVTWLISGHPDYPTTTIDVEESTTSFPRPDTELSENIKKMMYMGLGMPPEIVDSSLNIEFAASVYSSNLLLAKRCAQKQNILCGHMEDFVRKYSLSDGDLLSEMRTIIDRHKSRLVDYVPEGGQLRYPEVMATFLDALELKLPTPDQTKIEGQLTAVQNYLSLIDATLPLYVNQDVIRETMGEEYAQQTDAVYNAIRNNIVMDWLIQNNVVPELQYLVRKVDEDNPGDDFLTKRVERTTNLSVVIAQCIQSLAKRYGGEGQTDAGSSSFNTDTSGGTDGGGSDDFGSFYFGDTTEDKPSGEDDFTLDEPPSEEGNEETPGAGAKTPTP